MNNRQFAAPHRAAVGRPVPRRSAPTPAQLGLKLAALCLHYPGPEYRQVLAAVESELDRLPSLPHTVRQELKSFCAAVRQLPADAWESRYVSTFDFQKDNALYLGYHEHGESIRRSSAMVALKRQIARAGFLCPEDEMPDYIPLLLEYLAERPRSSPAGSLPARLARVLTAIAASLARSDSLYVPVLRAALAVLPAAPDQADPAVADEADPAAGTCHGASCPAGPCSGVPQSAFETGVIR